MLAGFVAQPTLALAVSDSSDDLVTVSVTAENFPNSGVVPHEDAVTSPPVTCPEGYRLVSFNFSVEKMLGASDVTIENNSAYVTIYNYSPDGPGGDTQLGKRKLTLSIQCKPLNK